jgi:hypothetical protein
MAPSLALGPDRLGLGPKCSGFLVAIERVKGFYNLRRRHSGLGFLTPAQAYEQMARTA